MEILQGILIPILFCFGFGMMFCIALLAVKWSNEGHDAKKPEEK